jgi:pilus assembly protein CpaF
MINGTEIYFEREGRIYPSPRKFKDVEEVKKVIDRIVQPIGRRVDESSPMVDGRLPDGSRVNIVMPPVSLDGPVITVRKFSPVGFTGEQMVRNRSYSAAMSSFFRLMVRYRQNIIIAGKTSSGKTTLLNVLGKYIPEGERIITIEDMAELQLDLRHVIRMEARPPNLQGRGEITIRTLFRNALRMRPDRIIVGECRGAETLDMLQAMNTGHDGSMSTAHANSSRDCFIRLEAMVGMSELQMNDRTVRKQISSGLDMVVYCTRFSDGQRKVTSVCEVLHGEGEDRDLQIREIFEFQRQGQDDQGRVTGTFRPTGYIPSFIHENEELNRDPDVMALFRKENA